jgi:cytochrome c oxidase cbb3-type subunit III
MNRAWSILLLLAMSTCGCKRERRAFEVPAEKAVPPHRPSMSGLIPGPTSYETATNLLHSDSFATNAANTNALPTSGSLEQPSTNRLQFVGAEKPPQVKNAYEENAFALAEGKRLFFWFNCYGCHGAGGGGMGPPLIDDKWFYGYEPEQIFASIVEGRPNGMPSFRDRIPEYQVWQLAAYVRSISGLVRKDAAPARSDHMETSPPENTKDPEKPHVVPVPSPVKTQ